MSTVEPTKTCNRCGITKPLDGFYKKKTNRGDYHRPDCKACVILYMKNLYEGKPPTERHTPRSGDELKKISYVYLIKLPDGTPLYVGKGRGLRIAMHAKKTHNKKVAEAYVVHGTLPIEILHEGLTDREALDLEKQAIVRIGRAPKGSLVNLTDGGQGCAGTIVSEETRRRRSKTRRGMKMSPEYCLAMKISNNRPERKAQKRASALAWHARMTEEEKRERATIIRVATIEAMNKPGVAKRQRDGCLMAARKRVVSCQQS